MTNYYFLATFLPELKIDEPPELDFRGLLELFKENLTHRDMAKVAIIRRYYDILNLRVYWKGQPLDPLGNMDENDLEEAFATQSGLPPYIFKFMEKYDSKALRLEHFPELLVDFFREEIKEADGFLKQFLMLEREIRLVLLAFRSKKLGRDLMKELQYENPEEDLIVQILAQRDAPVYEPPEKYENLKGLFEKSYHDPLEIHKALIEYRFQKIEEFLGVTDRFSINRILGYLVELILVEKWQELDKQKGLEIVDTILKDAT